MKKTSEASLILVLLGLMALPFARCARNTLGEQYGDGRVYFFVDLNPDWFPTYPDRPIEYGHAIISYTLEGEEPVSGLAYSVPDWSGERFDLLERSIEGGTEVSVSVITEHQGARQGGSVTFVVDGNVTLRFHQEDPTDRSSRLALDME